MDLEGGDLDFEDEVCFLLLFASILVGVLFMVMNYNDVFPFNRKNNQMII